MKWNPETGEFEVEREDQKRKREQPDANILGRCDPHAPAQDTQVEPKNPPIVDEPDRLLEIMPEHLIFDVEEFPRTIPEAEARVLSVLAFQFITGEYVHEWVNYDYWTEAQRRRFRKAEVNIARRLLSMALKKHPAPLGDTDDGDAD